MHKNVCSRSAAALLAVAMLAGCSDRSVLSPREELLSIDDAELREFHSTLYFPKGVGLRYPGYVVGLQKAPREKIMAPGDFDAPQDSARSFLRGNAAYFQAERAENKAWGLGTREHVLQKLQQDPHTFFVTHITSHWISTDNRGLPRNDECLIYNALRSPHLKEKDGNDLSSGLAWKSCAQRFREAKYGVGVPQWDGKALRDREFYANGLTALKTLEQAVAHDLALTHTDARGVTRRVYTHLLLIVMGWNTAQQEAVRNFNDLTGNIMAAAEEAQAHGATGEFRPLVVGVTWPSYWSTSFWNFLSYFNKANDADEVGLSWLNLVMNETLPNALNSARDTLAKNPAIAAGDRRAPLVTIGHSFGARATTRALFSAPALRLKPDEPERRLDSSVNLLVALQGAVSTNRFLGGQEGAPYRDFGALKTRVALTASEWDMAAGGPVFWYSPAGKMKSYHEACEGKEHWKGTNIFWCLTASEKPVFDGRQLNDPPPAGSKRCGINATPARQTDPDYPKSSFYLCGPDGTPRQTHEMAQMQKPPGQRVLYIDVSDHVTQYNSPGSGGTAHSDIYRLSTGRLVWSLLNMPYHDGARPLE